MANVRVLDKFVTGVSAAEKTTAQQILYQLFVPGGTLGSSGRLRVSVIASRVVNPITECVSVDCITCCGEETLESPDTGEFDAS